MSTELEFSAVGADVDNAFENPVTDEVIDSVWKANLPSMAFATIQFINGSCSREETEQALQLLHAEDAILYKLFRVEDRGEHHTIYKILVRHGMLDDSELAPEMMKILNEPTPAKLAWIKAETVKARSVPDSN